MTLVILILTLIVDRTDPEITFNFDMKNIQILKKLLIMYKGRIDLKLITGPSLISGLGLPLIEGLQFAKILRNDPQLELYFKRLNKKKMIFEKYLLITNTINNIH